MKNKGRFIHRFKDNPKEEIFAKAWDRQNSFPNSESRQTLDYLLAEDVNRPMGEVTNRDRQVAATVIQWLGSPVGQSWLMEVQEKIAELDKEQRA